MVSYTTTLLAAANLLALTQAAPAPAQPVCSAVTTVITGTPVWVPAGPSWGTWPTTATSTGKPTVSSGKATVSSGKVSTGGFYPVTSTSTSSWTTSSPIPVTTITINPTTPVTTPSTTPVTTPSTTPVTTPSTTTPAPAVPTTCDASDISVFSTDPSGSCGCEFAVTCNMHAPYTADTKFWERNSGEIIGSLAECQSICNENSACQAAIWVNKDGASSSEYMRCWQTSGLPQPDSDGYGQLSYKGACSGSCSSNYQG